jgi:DNA processing protein
MTTLAALAQACTRIRAEGTDAGDLAAVLAWSCGPRRTGDVLRRRLRDGDLSDVAQEVGFSATLARIARSDGGLDGPLADVALRIVDIWVRLGVRVALVGDAAYPALLREGWPTLDGPVLLAWRGEPPASSAPGVAIIGSRSATAYGTSVAELLSSAVARAGGRVVSGGAVGIDAAAHTAALGLPGGTTVVLGCGHAVAYPAPHARRDGLFARVLEDGGSLVSELLPEVAPHPGVIRARNRIVAGLATVTVVVEGGPRSGALLTATAAADRGREVLAVPGDILAPGSAAPLRLLGEGARPCTGPADVFAQLPGLEALPDPGGAASNGVRGGGAGGPDTGGLLPVTVRTVLEGAGSRGASVEDLAAAYPGGAGALVALLVRARVAGTVEEVDGGFRLRGPRPSVR